MNCLDTITITDFKTSLESSGCNKCTLSTLVRTKVVVSRGNHAAKILIVGQNPGADEDKFGSPFVGRAGQLLDKMMTAINIDTQRDCYLTNAALCWTPGNEDPSKYPGVLETCRPYLNKQIELLKPEVIIAVGKPAMESLCQRKVGGWLAQVVGKLSTVWGPQRGETPLDKYPVFPIMHPAYLLRNPDAKPQAWEHLKDLSGIIEQLGILPEYRKVA